MSEQKAKDTLKERSPRRIVGERLVARVGARGWQRPSWAPSARLFEIYRLGDPWDPTQGKQRSVGLGPVNLRLGEQRRQPAPHLKPRQPKPKAPPVPPAPRVPRASQPAPAPPPAAPVGPPPGETGFFGNTRGHRPLKGALPVRPGAAAQPQAAAPSPRPAPPSPPVDVPASSDPSAPSLPGLPPPRARGARRGRVSMRATPTRAPAAFEEVPVAAADAPVGSAPTAVVDATAEQARAPEPEAPQRKIPTGAMGLDDIFGGAADAGSRVRMGRRKKSE